MNIKSGTLKLLSDEEIERLNKRPVKLEADVSLVKSEAIPVVDGLYDPLIFGSIFICKCKLTRNGKCPSCGVEVLSIDQYKERHSYYKTYLPHINAILKVSFLNKFSSSYPEAYENIFGEESPDKMKYIDFLYNINGYLYEVRKGRLIVSELDPERYDELDKVGLIGLKNALKKLNDDSLLKYIHHNFVIVSPYWRIYHIIYLNSGVKIDFPIIHQYYKSLIKSDKILRDILEVQRLSKEDDQIYISQSDFAYIQYIFNQIVNSVYISSRLLETSKQNLFRTMLSIRAGRSGRLNIVSNQNLRIDQVGIPEYIAYQVLREEIILKLEKVKVEQILKRERGEKSIIIKPELEYKKRTPLAMEKFKEIVENSALIIGRNPTLHRYNIMAFEPVIIKDDNPVLHIPVMITEPFNADFDGDQMYFFFIKDMKDEIMNEMSPRVIWKYEKTDNPMFNPKIEHLYGLMLASEIRPKPGKLKEYSNIEQMDKDFFEGKIEVYESVKYKGNITTYGREKLKSILGKYYKIIDENEIITSKNISKIISALENDPDKINIVKNLENFALEVSTTYGLPTIDIHLLNKLQLPKIDLDDTPENIIIKVNTVIKDKILEEINNLPFSNLLKSSKINQIYEMIKSRVLEVGNDEIVLGDPIVKGMSEISLVDLAIENRKLMRLKQELTPKSGYANRQLVLASMKIKYEPNKSSPDKQGIEIPMRNAVGRTTLNGKIVPDNKSNKPVRIKSMIYSDEPVIYKDEISYKYKGTESVGIIFATSFTESMTQSALSLKHTGSLKFFDPKLAIKSVEDDIIEEITYEGITTKKGFTYYLPIKHSIPIEIKPETKVKKGQILAYNTEPQYVDRFINDIQTLLRITTSSDQTYHRSVRSKLAISPINGIIQINRDEHSFSIKIENLEDKVPLNTTIFFPSGYKVNECDIINNLVPNINYLHKNIDDEELVFKVFYTYLINKMPSLKIDIIEFVYKVLKLSNFGISASLRTDIENVATSLSYGYAKQKIDKILIPNRKIIDEITAKLLMEF